MILGAKRIHELGIIDSGYIPHQQRTALGKPVPSFGMGPAGYDFRLSLGSYYNSADSFFCPVRHTERGTVIELQPGETITQVVSFESFIMPPDVIGFILGKSGYTRRGIVLNGTALEPGWSGRLMFSISNHSHRSTVEINTHGGVGQVVFHLVDGASLYDGPNQGQGLT